MSTKPNSCDFRHNLLLVLAETRRWPIPTAVGLAILAVATAAQLHFQEGLDALAVVIGAVGYVAGGLGLKVFGLLMLNPIIRKAPFEGSYLVALFIVLVPIFVFFACGHYILSRMLGEQFPIIPLLLLYAVSYPVFALFFAGFFRASEALQLWRLRQSGKGDNSPN